MAKKAKKAKARKATKPPTPKSWTSRQVLDDWLKVLRKSLKGKRLEPQIFAAFEARLLNRIQQMLDDPTQDYNTARKATLAVAATLGTLCRTFTPGKEVSLAVFERAFALCKLHPRCPAGGGSGQWCDV